MKELALQLECCSGGGCCGGGGWAYDVSEAYAVSESCAFSDVAHMHTIIVNPDLQLILIDFGMHNRFQA